MEQVKEDKRLTINPKWITVPTDKSFRWMNWQNVPNALKEETKQVKSYGITTLYDNISDYVQDYKCDVKIAVTDLNQMAFMDLLFLLPVVPIAVVMQDMVALFNL